VTRDDNTNTNNNSNNNNNNNNCAVFVTRKKHAEITGKITKSLKISVKIAEGNNFSGILRHRWEDNIKI